MVEWETGLIWLVAALLAAIAARPADTQHARFASVASRIMDVAPGAARTDRGTGRRAALFATGPPTVLLLQFA